MTTARSCPALFVSAPASGQGKTTITAAIARRYRQQGRRVRVFKTGPDFLDPMILERASGAPVYQLDLWMGGDAHCRRLLYDAAGDTDVILVEGVMGLYDGQPSSADLAALFGIPVLAVIDGSAMAQTFGAVACGLAQYRRDVTVAGVIANRVAGPGHYRMLAESLPAGLPAFGWLGRDADIALPDRHLGLLQAGEIADLEDRLERAATRLVLARDDLPAPVTFAPVPTPALPRLLAGKRIAVARDAAFSFLYRANLDVLRALGAELLFFSPLADTQLPIADALYLPGGYPELHMTTLAGNRAMRSAVCAHHAAGKPMLAECGGLLYLLESLAGTDGQRTEMLGLLPGHAVMQTQLAAIAMQELTLPEGALRGHTFHHSRLETTLAPIARGVCPHGSKTAECAYRIDRLTASYVHSYFPSNPEAVARIFAS
ncbi:MAG: cobyrinate a,c-diamide synthase [Sulfurifustis sp.]